MYQQVILTLILIPKKEKNIIKVTKIENLELRTYPKYKTTRRRTTMDGIFLNKTIKTGAYMRTYNYRMTLYGQIPLSS